MSVRVIVSIGRLPKAGRASFVIARRFSSIDRLPFWSRASQSSRTVAKVGTFAFFGEFPFAISSRTASAFLRASANGTSG